MLEKSCLLRNRIEIFPFWGACKWSDWSCLAHPHVISLKLFSCRKLFFIPKFISRVTKKVPHWNLMQKMLTLSSGMTSHSFRVFDSSMLVCEVVSLLQHRNQDLIAVNELWVVLNGMILTSKEKKESMKFSVSESYCLELWQWIIANIRDKNSYYYIVGD